MAQASFPIVGQPLTDQQWGQVTLGIDSELRSGRTYTYKVVNGSSQVGSGSFTTLP